MLCILFCLEIDWLPLSFSLIFASSTWFPQIDFTEETNPEVFCIVWQQFRMQFTEYIAFFMAKGIQKSTFNVIPGFLAMKIYAIF